MSTERSHRLPSMDLANFLHQQHRDALLNEIALSGNGALDWDTTEDEIIEDAIEKADTLAAETEYDIDWSTVEYDDGEPTPSVWVRKPTYPVNILGFKAISFNHQTTLWQASMEVEKNSDFLRKSEADLAVRELSLNLHQQTEPSVYVGFSYRTVATLIVAPDVPVVAVHDKDLLYSAKKHGVDYPNPLRALSKVQADFGREAVDYVSDNVIKSLITALTVSPFEISKRRYE